MDGLPGIFETEDDGEACADTDVVEVQPTDDDGHPDYVTEKDLANVPKTSKVLVDPSVVAEFFQIAAQFRQNEVGGHLIGYTNGKFVHIERLEMLREVGTSTTIDFPPSEFDRVDDLLSDDEYIVGWAHSHPSYGIFMSGTDVNTQQRGQSFYADYVALVLDPFTRSGVDFQFFRVEDGTAKELPYSYWEPP